KPPSLLPLTRYKQAVAAAGRWLARSQHAAEATPNVSPIAVPTFQVLEPKAGEVHRRTRSHTTMPTKPATPMRRNSRRASRRTHAITRRRPVTQRPVEVRTRRHGRSSPSAQVGDQVRWL